MLDWIDVASAIRMKPGRAFPNSLCSRRPIAVKLYFHALCRRGIGQRIRPIPEGPKAQNGITAFFSPSISMDS
jgi:hypothetical protein